MPLAEVKRKNACTALAELNQQKSRLSQKVKVAFMCLQLKDCRDNTDNTRIFLVRWEIHFLWILTLIFNLVSTFRCRYNPPHHFSPPFPTQPTAVKDGDYKIIFGLKKFFLFQTDGEGNRAGMTSRFFRIFIRPNTTWMEFVVIVLFAFSIEKSQKMSLNMSLIFGLN